MKKLIIASILFMPLLASCGYDGSYRYPCQDPNNWEKKECSPPICTPSGSCTEYLITPKGGQ